MVNRVYIDGTNIVVSKAGFQASDPALANANKVFDSDWFFGGTILERKAFTFPRQSGAHTYVMNFDRTYSFVPGVLFHHYAPVGALLDFGEHQFPTITTPFFGAPDAGQVFNNRIQRAYSSTPELTFMMNGNPWMGWYVVLFSI